MTEKFSRSLPPLLTKRLFYQKSLEFLMEFLGGGKIKGTENNRTVGTWQRWDQRDKKTSKSYGVETQSLWWSITLSIKKQKGPPLHLHYFFYKLIFYFKGIKQFSLKYAIMFFNYEYQSAKQTKESSALFRFLQMWNFFLDVMKKNLALKFCCFCGFD